VAAASPGQSAPATTLEGTAATSSTSSLRLGTGDLVDVGVYNVPELTTKARVSSKGEIYLPLIDYVQVAGLTAEEAEGLIQKRLSDGGFVKNPHVTLFVDQYASQGASILGEVAKPGVYPVPGQQRLFDLISAAGGFTDKAGRSITITHRDQPDKSISVPSRAMSATTRRAILQSCPETRSLSAKPTWFTWWAMSEGRVDFSWTAGI